MNGIHPTPASAMPSSFYAASSVNILPNPSQFELHLPSDCDQICSNTYGSYTCSCVNGYQLAPNGKSCLGEYLALTFHYNPDIILARNIKSFEGHLHKFV